MHAKNERRLPKNRPIVLVVVLLLVLDWVARLRGRGRARGRTDSWSQCVRKNERGELQSAAGSFRQCHLRLYTTHASVLTYPAPSLDENDSLHPRLRVEAIRGNLVRRTPEHLQIILFRFWDELPVIVRDPFLPTHVPMDRGRDAGGVTTLQHGR